MQRQRDQPRAHTRCARFSCATGHGLAQNVIRSAGAVRFSVACLCKAASRWDGWALRRANGLRTRASLGLGYNVQCGVNARLHRRSDGGRRERQQGRGRQGVGSKSGDGTASRPPTRCANGCGIRQEALLLLLLYYRTACAQTARTGSQRRGWRGKNRGVYRRQGGGSLAATALAP